MLKIHQPYKCRSKCKYMLALSSIGVLLLGSLWFCNRLWEVFSPDTHPSFLASSSSNFSSNSSNSAYAAGDGRTIHDITYMQDMTQQICSNTDLYDTAVLKDNRTSGYSSGTMTGSNGEEHLLSEYVIVKLDDGNCWMQETLRLNGGITLTPNDSDVKSNWTGFKASNDSDWNTSDNTVVQMRTGKTGMAVSSSYPGDGKGWQPLYGNYYSWCAATAESCKLNRTGSAITSGEAAESICPKGWKLPTGNTSGQFQGLLGANGANITASDKVVGMNSSPYFFPAAGYVTTDGLRFQGTYGNYWSSAPHSNGSSTYSLSFDSSIINPANTGSRHLGFSVRCVAPGGLDKIDPEPAYSESKNGQVNVVVKPTLTIDATSGMSTTAKPEQIAEGSITATISSNSNKYKVMLSSKLKEGADSSINSTSLTDLNQPYLAGIPTTSTTNPVLPGNNAWGILKDPTIHTDSNGNKLYDPITTIPREYYYTSAPASNIDGSSSGSITTQGPNATTYTFGVGISISPNLNSGTYSTNVVVTAVDE